MKKAAKVTKKKKALQITKSAKKPSSKKKASRKKVEAKQAPVKEALAENLETKSDGQPAISLLGNAADLKFMNNVETIEKLGAPTDFWIELKKLNDKFYKEVRACADKYKLEIDTKVYFQLNT